MSGKKSSLTKQIAELIGTDDKREQLERITKLLKGVQAPSAAVTVLFARGKVDVAVVSTDNVTPDDVKYILQQGVDDITRQVVEAEYEQNYKQPEEMGDAELDELMNPGPEDFDPNATILPEDPDLEVTEDGQGLAGLA